MIMIIVIMLMNMAMNMFDVWSARLGHSRPLPAALPAPPTHKLRTKILCAASSSSSPPIKPNGHICFSYLPKHIPPQPNRDPT